MSLSDLHHLLKASKEPMLNPYCKIPACGAELILLCFLHLGAAINPYNLSQREQVHVVLHVIKEDNEEQRIRVR